MSSLLELTLPSGSMPGCCCDDLSSHTLDKGHLKFMCYLISQLRQTSTPNNGSNKRETKPTTPQYTHIISNIDDTSQVPSNWKEYIACRQCKQTLTTYLALKMLALSPSTMTCNDQKLLTAGPVEPMSSTMSGKIQNEEKYVSDAPEADSRIWRHCQQSHLTKQYIFSPDTDTYVVGLTNHKPVAETYIDLTTIGSKDTKLLNLNKLIDCFQRDPDLAHIDQQKLPTIFQSLMICQHWLRL